MLIRLNIKEKAFGKKVIFKNTKIEIEKKDFVVIYGESGIGKSTLLKMLGFIDGFNGEYYFEDKLIEKKEREKTRINNFSYLFQDSFLIPYLSVFDNIILPLKNLKMYIDEKDVFAIADRLKIKDLLNRKVENLSGGK